MDRRLSVLVRNDSAIRRWHCVLEGEEEDYLLRRILTKRLSDHIGITKNNKMHGKFIIFSSEKHVVNKNCLIFSKQKIHYQKKINIIWLNTFIIRYMLSYGTEHNSVSQVFTYNEFLWKKRFTLLVRGLKNIATEFCI